MTLLGDFASGAKLTLHSRLAAGAAVAGIGAVVADHACNDDTLTGGVLNPTLYGVMGVFGLGIAGQATSSIMRGIGIAEAAFGLTLAATSGGLGVYDAIHGQEQQAHTSHGGGGDSGIPKAGFNESRSIEVQVGPQPHGGAWTQLQFSDDAGQPIAKEQASNVEVTEYAADGKVTFRTSGTMGPHT